MRTTAYLGLGSNMADPIAQLQRAWFDLKKLPDTQVIAGSSLYRSAPVGYLDQPDFVNAVVQIETRLSPQQLLQQLFVIEQEHGRQRTFRNAPRTLDLDILLYGDLKLHEPGLTLPHPQMQLRAFVLLPLLELAPDCEIPDLGPVQHFVAACAEQDLAKMPEVLGW